MEAGVAREKQRGWLLNTLLLAQALMALALIPSYIIPKLNIPLLACSGVALLLYATAFIINRTQGRFSLAVSLLIYGGSVITTAGVFLTAILGHSGYDTAQAALFYLPIIIESGLFLAPELTLILSGVAVVLTASGILIALALAGASTEVGLAYQLVVNSLGLLALTCYMSWQLATFIFENNTASQTAEDLRFAQARLEANTRQTQDQRRALQREAGQIQAAVSSMLSHEYDARIDIQDGELAPLAESLNLLFERLRSTNEMEHKMRQMEAGVPPLVDMADRMANANTPAQADVMTANDALYPVGAALVNAQAAQARRLASLYQLSSDIADELRVTQIQIDGAASESGRALADAGKLSALAKKIESYAGREVELLAQARRLLAQLLPKELTNTPHAGQRDPLRATPNSATGGEFDGLFRDIGLTDEASGLTGTFDALTPADPKEAGIAPLTVRINALDSNAGETQNPAAIFSSGQIPGELVDSWGLLREAHSVAAQDHSELAQLNHDLALVIRAIRETEATLSESLQALDMSRQRADHAQSLSSGAGGDPASEQAARLNAPGAGRPRPQATRPLASDTRLSEAMGVTYDPLNPTPAPGSIRVQDLLNPGSAPFGQNPAILPPSDPNDSSTR